MSKQEKENSTLQDEKVSLRDYIAGQAINGILGNSDLLSQLRGNTEETDLMAARTAYRIADCMLRVRNEG